MKTATVSCFTSRLTKPSCQPGMSCAPAPWASYSPSTVFALECQCLSNTGSSKLGTDVKGESSLPLTAPLTQPRMPLAFVDTKARCWLLVNLFSTRIPRSLFYRVFSLPAPSLSWSFSILKAGPCIHLCWTLRFLSACFSSLSRFTSTAALAPVSNCKSFFQFSEMHLKSPWLLVFNQLQAYHVVLKILLSHLSLSSWEYWPKSDINNRIVRETPLSIMTYPLKVILPLGCHCSKCIPVLNFIAFFFKLYLVVEQCSTTSKGSMTVGLQIWVLFTCFLSPRELFYFIT